MYVREGGEAGFRSGPTGTVWCCGWAFVRSIEDFHAVQRHHCSFLLTWPTKVLRYVQELWFSDDVHTGAIRKPCWVAALMASQSKAIFEPKS